MDPISNALGFEDAVARFRDGREENVQVRVVPIRQVGALARCIDNPADVVGICTGKRPEWVDRLTDDSLYDLDEKARNLNRPPLARWLKRQGAVLVDLSGEIPIPASPSPTPSPSAP